MIYHSARGRWVVAVTVLGSAMASIDATVVGIALPTIGREFKASVVQLQWVSNAYTLTLAGLLLLGGALGDRFGRKIVFQIGTAWFALASLLCGAAPNSAALIGARALQGVGAAREPGHPPGVFCPGRTFEGDRSVGGPERRGHGHRAFHWRMAYKHGLVEAHIPHKPACCHRGTGGIEASRAGIEK